MIRLGGNELTHPFGVAHYKQWMFWSDYHKGEIYRYNMTNSKANPELMRTGGMMFELRVYDAEAQAGKLIQSFSKAGMRIFSGLNRNSVFYTLKKAPQIFYA